jgi:hypothetical protein
MDISSFIKASMKQSRDAVMRLSDQMTLGNLLSELEKIDTGDEDLEKRVYFDFGDTNPNGFGSWRGSYDEVCIHYGEHNAPKLYDFINQVKETIGKTFCGWKGGEFTMEESTPVWVANSGCASHSALIAVVDTGYSVILMTAYREYM